MSDPLLWHRLQFAFTIVFHYLFPQLTMGLALLIVVMKAIGLRTGDERWNDAARFWIRIFGVNFAVGVASRPLDFVQINYSVGEREAEQRLLPLAQERGAAVIANRPFAGGDLFRRLRSRRLPAWAAEIDCDSWAQLLLKFVVSHPAITCAIPATSRVAHLRDNMKAAYGRLPDGKLRARIAAEAM